MKKLIIKLIRKIIYLILMLFKFPKVKVKSNNLDLIEKEYELKKINVVNNNLKINDSVNLSIIVPAYNVQKLIKKCADSLVNQNTKYKYNIIFINDGSSDNTLNILKEYEKNNDIVKVFTQENKGISETRNFGIKNIIGEYVAFIDSDDFVTSDYIEKLLDSAYQNNADIVRCNYYEYDVDKDCIIKIGNNNSDTVIAGEIGKYILNYKGYPWGGVFKSSLWSDIEFPNGYWYEDMIIRMILFRKSKVFSYINDKLYYYCLHSNNISKSIEKTFNIKCLDHFFLISKLYKLSNDLNIKDDEALYSNMLYEYSSVLWLRTRGLDKDLRKEVFNRACKIINSINYKGTISKEEKVVTNIFKRKDYISWKLFAIYKMLAVKYGVE